MSAALKLKPAFGETAPLSQKPHRGANRPASRLVWVNPELSPRTHRENPPAKLKLAAGGRFVSADPVEANRETGANFNRYWYANNNPYKFVDPNGEAGKVAWLVKLSANGMRRVSRVTQQQAVRARRAEQNIVADRRQVAGQIETAAHGREGQLKHAAHELGDRSRGLPHYQTEGAKGHSFWGKVSVAAAAIAGTLDQVAESAEYIPDVAPRPATQDDLIRTNGIIGKINNATGLGIPKYNTEIKTDGFQDFFRVEDRLDRE